MKIIITSKNTFNTFVQSVDVTNVKNVTDKSFYANVEIELKDTSVHSIISDKIEIDGEFGYEDYKEQYGFIFSK